jgi:co-chaperonin GroES (HSP10)
MSDEAVQTEFTDAEKATQLPTPAGFKILCAIPSLDTKFFKDGVIERPHDKREQQATVVLFVVKMGPDCYTDKERYPSGPWCKEGDFVITRMYAGTRLTIHGKDFCVINEDQVEAVVEDPRGIGRA